MSSITIACRNGADVSEGPDVLVVDDQAAMRYALTAWLRATLRPVPRVHAVAGLAAALDVLKTRVLRLVLLDVRLGADDGLALLPEIDEATAVLVLTSSPDPSTTARALAGGASAVCDKAGGFTSLQAGLAACMAQVVARPRSMDDGMGLCPDE